jgi:DNA/RNA endonuclease YhcR with UshA esterase domain
MAMLWAVSANAANLTTGEAPSHVGETATVCGVVASAKYSTRSQSQPTFLDLDKPYPDEPFTVVIFGIDRAKFGQPENTLRGKRICATGKIELYKGKPEVIVHEPSQITQ